MRVNLKPPAAIQNPAITSSQAACHSGKLKQNMANSLLAEYGIQKNQFLLTNQESEELGIQMESLGVEFSAAEQCCMWPNLQLFKSTREF